jgi:hypothetical protein
MRYYCPQYSDNQRGWVDVESLASKSKKEADAGAKAVAEKLTRVTRVIRKPKGWEPDLGIKTRLPNNGWGIDIGEQMREARKGKRG